LLLRGTHFTLFARDLGGSYMTYTSVSDRLLAPVLSPCMSLIAFQR